VGQGALALPLVQLADDGVAKILARVQILDLETLADGHHVVRKLELLDQLSIAEPVLYALLLDGQNLLLFLGGVVFGVLGEIAEGGRGLEFLGHVVLFLLDILDPLLQPVQGRSEHVHRHGASPLNRSQGAI